MSITEDELARLRGLLAALRAPLTIRHNGPDDDFIDNAEDEEIGRGLGYDSAPMIVDAVNAVAPLLDALEEAERERDRAKSTNMEWLFLAEKIRQERNQALADLATASRERDEARAEVERLKVENAERRGR